MIAESLGTEIVEGDQARVDGNGLAAILISGCIPSATTTSAKQNRTSHVFFDIKKLSKSVLYEE
jgi:hypothetical protein